MEKKKKEWHSINVLVEKETDDEEEKIFFWKNNYHCFIEEKDKSWSTELVQLRLVVLAAVVVAVIDQLVGRDRIEMLYDIFLYVYSLDRLIDRISYVENNPILVHVVICDD